MDRQLLRRFLELYPFQPATAVWRAAEIHELAKVRFPAGLGLDLGCGDGRLTRVLSEEVGGLRLVGLDIDPLETELAKGELDYLRVHTTSAEAIPEADATFDYVVSVSVMEHIPPLEKVLAECARVLKPGGMLVTTVPSAGFHNCMRGPVLPGSTRQQYLRDLDVRVAHLRYWTIDEWKSALTVAGFHLTDARPIMSAGVMRRWETLSRTTAGLLRAFARQKAPIEIQRSLGLRRAGQHMPRPIAAALAATLAIGVSDRAPSGEMDSGCLIVTAVRS